jgi:hypothetical protein
MPIDFPTTGLTPDVTTYTYSGRTWIWTGTVWQSVGTAQGVQGVQGVQGTTGTGTQGTTGTLPTYVFNAKTASYEIQASDVNKIVTMSVGTANNLTVPSGTFTTGQVIYAQQIGAGQTTIVASGVTITSTPGLKLRAQYSMAAIICTGTNTFTVSGDLVA